MSLHRILVVTHHFQRGRQQMRKWGGGDNQRFPEYKVLTEFNCLYKNKKND